jgi:quercetin dioxygenase-like cupin family protein
MKGSSIEKAPKFQPFKGVEIKILGSKEKLSLCYALIEPGAILIEHSHPSEQIGMCIRGTGELTSGGYILKTSPGTSWTIPANEKHSYRNTGSETVEVIEAFSPPREDYLKLAK